MPTRLSNIAKNRSGEAIICIHKVGAQNNREEINKSFRLASSCFRLKDGDNFGDRLAFCRVALPRSLDHLPHTVGEFGVVRANRSTSI
jgi:hypothetical protein